MTFSQLNVLESLWFFDPPPPIALLHPILLIFSGYITLSVLSNIHSSLKPSLCSSSLSSPFNFFLSFQSSPSHSGSRSLSLSLVLHPCLLTPLPAICLCPYPALNFKFSSTRLSQPFSLIKFSPSCLFLLPFCLCLFVSPLLSASLNCKDRIIVCKGRPFQECFFEIAM